MALMHYKMEKEKNSSQYISRYLTYICLLSLLVGSVALLGNTKSRRGSISDERPIVINNHCRGPIQPVQLFHVGNALSPVLVTDLPEITREATYP
ncbi:hypothetical protein TNIN_127901 [Trichonephila inaurata madagascariensis]|uniref:Uncharacterized protein n=1 Tax=Trichonephila inaurata madagascariensis TaxID=2747483 RepID=A0A8X6YWE3_9ARAC|nr:hypothetical protein TNIN_127901 [Trichonephila inaurata madagascariensis]